MLAGLYDNSMCLLNLTVSVKKSSLAALFAVNIVEIEQYVLNLIG